MDAVIVGAGPAGCECARRLAAAGYSVAVIEEHDSAGEPVHCTGIISAHAYEAFSLPLDPVQSELTAAELISPGGVCLRVDLNGTRAYTVDRRAVDLALARRAEEAGALFSYRTKVREASVDPTGVRLVGTRSGRPWSLRARAVVLATGARSRLPVALGLAASRGAVWGAQAEVPVASPTTTMRVWLGRALVPGGFGWVVPGAPGWSRVGVLTRGNPRQALRRLAERALDGAGKEIVEARVRVHPVPAAPRCPSYADRVLSVGDAAGQVKMTTGGGVYYGLLGARIASEVLSEALSHDRLDRRHLARYEQLWRCLLGPEQKAGQMLRKLAHSMPDEAIDDIFRAADAQGMSRYLVDLLDFDWHARPGVGLALSMLAAAPDAGRGLRWLRKLLT